MKKLTITAIGLLFTFSIFAQSNPNDRKLYDAVMQKVKKKYAKKSAREDSLFKKAEEDSGGSGRLFVPKEAMIIESFLRHEAMIQFMKENPNSAYSMHLLTEYNTTDQDELDKLFKMLSDSLKTSTEGKEFSLKMSRMTGRNNGKMAPDFTSIDENGKPVSLSFFRGKYVLLDFWGSWCGPCKTQLPVLKKAYEKYHNKNFTVLSVAIENKKEDWLKAIKTYGLTWPQLSDISGFNNQASKKYVVEAVPRNYLIDPHGKIIAQDLMNDDVDKALEKHLK